MSANLLRLAIGSLRLTPTFDQTGTTVAYTATTPNASDKVTAVAESPNATIEIKVGGTTVVDNGGNAPWSVGSNSLTVKVTVGETNKTYTVTVTRSSGT